MKIEPDDPQWTAYALSELDDQQRQELESMLDRSAISQERELEMTVGTLMAVFEPLMVVVMGGLVLTIVLAVLLPIFDLNTMVR